MPVEYGRRLARERLLGQVTELTGSQVGRARGDLQYQLAEASRRLLADLRRRNAGSVGRLAAALEGAGAIRAAAGEAGDRQLAELGRRESALRAVLGHLAGSATGASSG